MATRRKNEDERLDETHMERVIEALSREKPITKKEACQILGIAYNTTRLGTLIEKYQERKALDTKRRAALKGKPATQEEITYIIAEYLQGETVDAISKSTFRSPGFVKSILDRYSVPIRAGKHDYFNPELVPEGAMRDRFQIGEKVYSTRYDSLATIETERFDDRYGWIYRIWLLSDKWLQYSNSPAYDLASLAHLREIGVRI